mgnify:CR=1 FL=1
MNGAAAGAGMNLALACDLRVLSAHAYLQEKFVKIGLMPDGGAQGDAVAHVGIALPTDAIERTPTEITLDGIRFVFQYTPHSEAPAIRMRKTAIPPWCSVVQVCVIVPASVPRWCSKALRVAASGQACGWRSGAYGLFEA